MFESMSKVGFGMTPREIQYGPGEFIDPDKKKDDTEKKMFMEKEKRRLIQLQNFKENLRQKTKKNIV